MGVADRRELSRHGGFKLNTDYLIFALAITCAFLFGKILAQQKAQTKLSELTFGAAVWSLCEAKALRSGAVIQRIIERNHFVKDHDQEELTKETKATNDAFDAAIDGLQVKKNKITGAENFDPEDLV